MRIQRSKGMRDMPPEEMKVFRRVEKTCHDCFARWGYREVRTPTIEYMHLFTAAGTLTPGRLGKVYSFLDWDGWSGERVVLRPDGTIPVARLYAESMPGQRPARLCYTANTFIFEEDAEKTRERWQCGAELIGVNSAVADIELIALALEIIEKLGVKGVSLRLSHAGLIKALLAKPELSAEEQTRVYDEILDGEKRASDEAVASGATMESALAPLLGLKGSSSEFLRNQRAILVKSVPGIKAAFDNFLRTVGLLDALGISYEVDIASGAGFEYYTGFIFQLYAGEEKIGGGGRYDALVPAMGGGDVPAAGLAVYLDRLVRLAGTEMKDEPATKTVRLRLDESNIDSVKVAFSLAAHLRQGGYNAEIDLGDRSSAEGWIIEVDDKVPVFTVIETKTKKRTETSSNDEVLEYLGGRGGG